MLCRLKKDTFIRRYGEIAYICNLGNRKDLVFDSFGSVFLSVLSKELKSFDSIAASVAALYVNVDILRIEKDLNDFLVLLEQQGYIVCGESVEELNQKENKDIVGGGIAGKHSVNYVPVIKKSVLPTQHFLRQYFHKNPYLVSVQIEVSNMCNERCIHCYIPHSLKIKNMDVGLFKNIIQQCHNLGVLTIVLTGGEPMVHPEFIDFLNILKRYDFEVKVLSNLTCLNEGIIKALKNVSCSGVQVSLYSMDAKIHDLITGKKGSFDMTVASIMQLREAGIPVQISCVVMRENRDSYKELISWADGLGISVTLDYILMGRYDGTTSNLEHRLTSKEVESIIRDVIDNNTDYRDEILKADLDSLSHSDENNDAICNVCRSTIGIAADGNVYPCVGWQGNVLGNLNESSLRDIWFGSSKVCQLRQLEKKDFPKCAQCDSKAFCSMCLVRNANENDGDYMKISGYTCDVAKLNRRIVLEYRMMSGIT